MIVITGDPINGYRFFGPFEDAEDAGNFAEIALRNQEWWIAEISTPDPSHPDYPYDVFTREVR